MTKEKLALEVIKRLKEAYPLADCTLDYDHAWQLLVEVRLAAQCTDARVNVVVQKLFEKYPALKAMCTSADGNIYALAGWWGDINDYVPDYLYIRQDWLDNLGLEMPRTIDELYDVLVAFKEQDANGNGDPNDEIPLATKNGIWQLYYLMTGFGYDTNSLWYVDEAGEVHYAAVEEQYREMLEFLNKCYSEGLISDDLEGNLLTQNITEDKVGIVCHDPADNMASSDDLAMTGNPNCDYEFMPVIQTDENGTAQMTKSTRARMGACFTTMGLRG